MSVRVVDTNVLVGISLAYDRHHESALDYVTNAPSDVYLPPTAHTEFQDIEADVRDDLSDSFLEHQSDVIEAFDSGKLGRDQMRFARDKLVDQTMDAGPALTDYYDNLISNRVEIYRLEIVEDLNDMAQEVYKDAAKTAGEDIEGWQDLLDIWSRGGGNYYSLENSLLICEGKDPQICIEAHHIAKKLSSSVELGSADGDFVDKKDGEPRSRKDDIEKKTALARVRDLR